MLLSSICRNIFVSQFKTEKKKKSFLIPCLNPKYGAVFPKQNTLKGSKAINSAIYQAVSANCLHWIIVFTIQPNSVIYVQEVSHPHSEKLET